MKRSRICEPALVESKLMWYKCDSGKSCRFFEPDDVQLPPGSASPQIDQVAVFSAFENVSRPALLIASSGVSIAFAHNL